MQTLLTLPCLVCIPCLPCVQSLPFLKTSLAADATDPYFHTRDVAPVCLCPHPAFSVPSPNILPEVASRVRTQPGACATAQSHNNLVDILNLWGPFC